MPTCSELIETEIFPDELNMKNDSLEQSEIKKPIGPSIIGLPTSNLSLNNNRKDFHNTSHSSFSTLNSSQQTHTTTYSATINRDRSPTKSALNKQRIKSSSQYSNLKTRFLYFLINEIFNIFLVLFHYNMINQNFHSVSEHE